MSEERMTCFNNSHRFRDEDESLVLTKRCWSVDIQCVIYTVHRPHTRYNTAGAGTGRLWWKQDNFLFWNSRRFDYLRRNTPFQTSSNTGYMSALPARWRCPAAWRTRSGWSSGRGTGSASATPATSPATPGTNSSAATTRVSVTNILTSTYFLSPPPCVTYRSKDLVKL